MYCTYMSIACGHIYISRLLKFIISKQEKIQNHYTFKITLTYCVIEIELIN